MGFVGDTVGHTQHVLHPGSLARLALAAVTGSTPGSVQAGLRRTRLGSGGAGGEAGADDRLDGREVGRDVLDALGPVEQVRQMLG